MSKSVRPPPTVTADNAKTVLRLYVAGSTPRSSRAIANIKVICETYLKDAYALTVVDLYENNQCAGEDQIVVAPTLIRQFPLPERRLFGDLSRDAPILEALDIPPTPLP